MTRVLLACLLLTGCAPQCFQFDPNRNCPLIDFDLGESNIKNLSREA